VSKGVTLSLNPNGQSRKHWFQPKTINKAKLVKNFQKREILCFFYTWPQRYMYEKLPFAGRFPIKI
jgi:hypothetical protein